MKKNFKQELKLWDRNLRLLQTQLELPTSHEQIAHKRQQDKLKSLRGQIRHYQTEIEKKIFKIFSPKAHHNLISEKEQALLYWVKDICKVLEDYYKNLLSCSPKLLWSKLLSLRANELASQAAHKTMARKNTEDLKSYYERLNLKLAELKEEQLTLQDKYELLLIARANRTCAQFSKNLAWQEYKKSFKKAFTKTALCKRSPSKKILDPLHALSHKTKADKLKFLGLRSRAPESKLYRQALEDFDKDLEGEVQNKDKKNSFFEPFKFKKSSSNLKSF